MLRKKLLLKLFTVTALVAPLSALATPTYSLTFLPENFNAYDIGSNGLIVGSFGTFDAFVPSTWANGVLTNYSTLGGARGQFNAISSNGIMAGVSDLANDTAGHAFVFQNGTMSMLSNGLSPGYESIGAGINASGQVAGYLWSGIRPTGAFLYADGGAKMIAGETYKFGNAIDINDAGVVIGNGTRWDTDASHAFMYSNGVTTDLGALNPVTDNSYANAINNLGDIVGSSLDATSHYHAFIYSHGQMRDIGGFDGYASASDINNLGQVVGSGSSSAFLYTGDEMLDLNALTTGISGWKISRATAINDAGQIIGTACNNGNCRNVLLDPVSAVPEPSAWALLMAGLGGLAMRRARRIRAA